MDNQLRVKVRKIIKEYYDFYPDFFDPLANPEIDGFIGRKENSVSINEYVVEEGARGFMDVPPSVGLIVIEGGFRGVSVALFDFKEKKCYGYVFLSEFSDKSYGLINIAAEPGYGPLITECAMMSVYPKGICVDRVGDTKQKVWDMMKKFADSRGDITKVVISKKDMEYDGRYLEQGDEDKHYIMNLLFSRTPSAWYNKLLERGVRLSEETGIGPTEVRYICREYFSGRYENG
jgi:hypothetical protein